MKWSYCLKVTRLGCLYIVQRNTKSTPKLSSMRCRLSINRHASQTSPSCVLRARRHQVGRGTTEPWPR
ncbi:hypothetical protein OJAV_G00120570 [Oryzias javanicus]|uniref:Uncharacterized protein n=1 Tax=Oryzias javanicus TaxID=123683 RepID=A0A3S2MEV2_ORYJA|nr:hypothetical protein OJAV_G00120570 [Oryzias javanicus]